MSLQLRDFPFELNASDIVKHIIAIDSRFREVESTATSSNFHYRLLTPIRNVLRVRITSIELPNNYHIFSKYRRNVTMKINYGSTSRTVIIPDGNYLADGMIAELNTTIQAFAPWLTAFFDTNSGQFSFYATDNPSTPFSIDTACVGMKQSDGLCQEVDVTYDRPFDYGLGYNLGFSRKIHTSIPDPDVSSAQYVISDQMAYFAGDPYVFLKINNFDCVRQTIGKSNFTALSKIVIREPKDYMTFDDYAGNHAKEFTFPAPTDLSRFHIQLLDPYGNNINMGSSQFSFSIEVLEVRNLSLYNMIRDAFATGWTL
jgi:hypothetical protein